MGQEGQTAENVKSVYGAAIATPNHARKYR